jgi:Protein of unknown function (DUF2934)
MTDREERIRELAYFLWLEEGCPEDAAERHWLAAEALVEADERKRIEGEPPGQPPNDSRPGSGRPAVSEARSRLKST